MGAGRRKIRELLITGGEHAPDEGVHHTLHALEVAGRHTGFVQEHDAQAFERIAERFEDQRVDTSTLGQPKLFVEELNDRRLGFGPSRGQGEAARVDSSWSSRSSRPLVAWNSR